MASSAAVLECSEDVPQAKKRKLCRGDDGQVSEGGLLVSAVPEEASSPTASTISRDLLAIEESLCRKLEAIEFGLPITHIYNPLDYAKQTHSHFVKCYGNSTKKVLFVGMNPGPFGMAQNGVAFGDTAMVRDWLGIHGVVGKPAVEHPSRIIHGLDCARSEVSGSRFWGLFKELCHTPQTFFKHCYVHNYCPLCFMNKTGKNITPPSLKVAERNQLLSVCDAALLEVIRLLGVQWVVGVGKFGADRAKAALKTNCTAGAEGKKASVCCGKRSAEMKGVERFVLHGCKGGRGGKEREVFVSSIMHPSPINPAANQGWAQLATQQLSELGLLDTIQATSKRKGERKREEG